MRPQHDANGRLQETEPYAKYLVWLAPVAAVVSLVAGTGFAISFAWAGDTGGVIVTLVVLAIALLNCWVGFVQARRALRSDRLDAEGRRGDGRD
ncbi:hypothetical protein GCM10011490_24920 [Pseudoclavibacter endophyticus]|uniref:UsfY protein n=1 Tax=Pseudoclavibacter endophyticus TaxID=1778590 RepID=A0A6H9WB46_9MICO|nr:hypothetical protein [Pseudoclavibacter endophyticus]KAB1647823.1 hypothetical protein F8O04_12445 [Pseudoclavibacter endophyticus]GGA73117.1 hypothetical protein GCM10011490_24920 [Pseudoclavibacter endophyticus]